MGIVLGLLLAAPLLRAEALTASQISERALRSNAFRYTNARTRVRMVLTGPDGKRSERVLEVLGRNTDEGYQSVVRFLAPQDIAGTAFLMLERGRSGSEQYLYLPAIKRTRRIAGRERDGSFMGSDFTYADLQGLDPKDAEHERLPDEKIGSDACYVVESTLLPAAKAAYGKLVAWVRQSDFIALRTRFYDRSGKLAKTLYSRRIRNVNGSPVVVEARMQNEQAKHTTELFVDSIEHRDDLSDAQFTPTALEH
ncbi:MAG TPA: outer membrane lipoprotein-sorting protein [Polyangiales bacterium]|nr:outer membrane lipoprotein-sorting protein [Polyangiales bacterium]